MDLDSQKNGQRTGQTTGTFRKTASGTPADAVAPALDATNGHVRDILRAHLSDAAAEGSLQRWAALSCNYPSQDALFNSIVEFTREIAKTHNLDTIAKQNIRSGMFQRLLRHRA